MANNVYIGARCVPKVEGDFDNTKVYEPLSIVRFNGASYIAKRTTIAGTLPTNSDYWMNCSIDDAMVIQIQSDLQALTEDYDQTQSNGLDHMTVEILRIPAFREILSGDSDFKSLQGAAYNSSRDTILLSFDNTARTDAMLVEVSRDFTTVIRRKQMGSDYLGHGNDITYCPDNHKYYFATPRGSGAQEARLAIVDGDSLDYEGYQDLDPSYSTAGNNPWEVAYDKAAKNFVVIWTKMIQVYDLDFNLLKSNPINYTYYANNVMDGCSKQSSEIKDGRLYVTLYSHGTDASHVDGNSVIIIDYNTAEIVSSFTIGRQVTGDEVEGIVNIDGVLYFTFNTPDYGYAVKRVTDQTHANIISGESLFTSGTSIPDGTDLNDIITVGKYYTDDASTLLNAYMTQYDCSLLVIDNGFNSVIQIMSYTSSGILLAGYREYRPNSNTWTDWIDIGVGVPAMSRDYDLGTLLTAGYIDNSGKDIRFFIPYKNFTKLTSAQLSITSGTMTIKLNGHNVVDTDGVTPQITLSDKTVTLFPHKTGILARVRKNDTSVWLLDDASNVPDADSISVLLGNLIVTATV